jgi:hypothetical protein
MGEDYSMDDGAIAIRIRTPMRGILPSCARARRRHFTQNTEKSPSPHVHPDGIGSTLLVVLKSPAYHFKRTGLEAGPFSQWLFSGLAEAELPVVCVETRHRQDRSGSEGAERAGSGAEDAD